MIDFEAVFDRYLDHFGLQKAPFLTKTWGRFWKYKDESMILRMNGNMNSVDQQIKHIKFFIHISNLYFYDTYT